jgi:hypothetical protein
LESKLQKCSALGIQISSRSSTKEDHPPIWVKLDTPTEEIITKFKNSSFKSKEQVLLEKIQEHKIDIRNKKRKMRFEQLHETKQILKKNSIELEGVQIA